MAAPLVVAGEAREASGIKKKAGLRRNYADRPICFSGR